MTVQIQGLGKGLWNELAEDWLVWSPVLVLWIVLAGLSWFVGQGVHLEPLWGFIGLLIGLFANKRSQRRQNTFEVSKQFEAMIADRWNAVQVFVAQREQEEITFSALVQKLYDEGSHDKAKAVLAMGQFFDHLRDAYDGRIIDAKLGRKLFRRPFNQCWPHFERMAQAWRNKPKRKSSAVSDATESSTEDPVSVETPALNEDFQLMERVCGLKDWLYDEEYQRIREQEEKKRKERIEKRIREQQKKGKEAG